MGRYKKTGEYFNIENRAGRITRVILILMLSLNVITFFIAIAQRLTYAIENNFTLIVFLALIFGERPLIWPAAWNPKGCP